MGKFDFIKKQRSILLALILFMIISAILFYLDRLIPVAATLGLIFLVGTPILFVYSRFVKKVTFEDEVMMTLNSKKYKTFISKMSKDDILKAIKYMKIFAIVVPIAVLLIYYFGRIISLAVALIAIAMCESMIAVYIKRYAEELQSRLSKSYPLQVPWSNCFHFADLMQTAS